MPVSLVFLKQLLLAVTVDTILTTFVMLPRCVRESRFQSIILLLIVLSTGNLSAWLFHNQWLILAVVLPPLLVCLIDCSWSPWARINVACLIQNALVFLLFSGAAALNSSNLVMSLLGGIAWIAQVVSVLVTLFAAFDLLSVVGRSSFPERDRVLRVPEPVRWPSVCIQVPAHNEPPELLAQTISRLMRQDYPGRWMIQVVDNNTPDPRNWRPIQTFCQRWGDHVEFIHLDNWPGFKSGALNEGSRRLPAWVEAVAVIDADYLVEPNFLRATCRHFVDPRIAYVQTPQHYREWQGNAYLEGLNYMYEWFFSISMASRREMNGIVCFGSMCLIRRSALEQIGGWDEESITEDVELSVRLLGCGWRGVYDHRYYGAGLMPFDFNALKKQRFRWAFGMIQTLKKHWRLMLGLPSPEGYRLSLKQRLSFCGLGLQYFAEVPPLLLALLQVAIVLKYSLRGSIDASTLIIAVIGPIWLIGIAGVRTIWALREVTNCTRSQALGAFIFSLALSWTTAYACISACVSKKGVFLRTPKIHSQQKWQQAMRTTSQEIKLSLFFLSMAFIVLAYAFMLFPIVILLLFQSGVYAQAVVCACAADGIWLLPRILFWTIQRGNSSCVGEEDNLIAAQTSSSNKTHQVIRRKSAADGFPLRECNTNPRSTGQFSKRETRSHSRIPNPARLIPLNAD